MILIRLVVVLAALVVGCSLALYLFTRNPRYLDFAWRCFRLFVLIFAVVALLFILERLVLI